MRLARSAPSRARRSGGQLRAASGSIDRRCVPRQRRLPAAAQRRRAEGHPQARRHAARSRAARRPTASRRSRAPSSPSTRPTRSGGVGGYKIELRPARPCRQRQVQRAAGRPGHADVRRRRRGHRRRRARTTRPSPRSRSRSATTAGLLQCSPANTNEALTKPEFGALDYRKNFPDRINYIRVAATDDIQGPAMAIYAYNTLGLKNLLIVDDVTTFGKGVADNFQKKFEELGGTVADRVGAGARHDRLQRDHHRRQGQEPGRRLLRRRRHLRWRPAPQADAPAGPDHPVHSAPTASSTAPATPRARSSRSPARTPRPARTARSPRSATSRPRPTSTRPSPSTSRTTPTSRPPAPTAARRTPARRSS